MTAKADTSASMASTLPQAQWSDTGGCGADASEIAASNDVLVAYVERLGMALKAMSEEVQAVESRQTTLDRRLTELDALMQGLQEEQYAAMCSPRQPSAPESQRGEAHNPFDGLHQLVLIGNQGAAPSSGPEASGMALALRDNRDSREHDSIQSRLQAIERDQKTVAVGVHRALQAALVARQENQWRTKEDDWHRCLEGLIKPAAELEQQWASRFNEQDLRLERIIHMVDSLADNVLRISDSKAVADARAPALDDSDRQSVTELHEKMRELEGHMFFAFSAQSSAPPPALVAPQLAEASAEMLATVQALETQTHNNFVKITQRLDALEEGGADQRINIRALTRQIPELSQRVDQLGDQCHDYFPRIKEQDVRLDLYKKSFESFKHHMLEAMLHVQPVRLAGSEEHTFGSLDEDRYPPGSPGVILREDDKQDNLLREPLSARSHLGVSSLGSQHGPVHPTLLPAGLNTRA